MRLVVVLLFLICACHNAETVQPTFADCDLTSRVGVRMERFVFHTLATGRIKTTEGDTVSIGALRRDTSFFLVLDKDTITDPLWNSDIVSTVSELNTSGYPYARVKLFDDRNLSEAVAELSASDSIFFLVNISTDSNYRDIGTGVIHTVNMDDDPAQERVLELVGGYRGRYCFFDDSLSGWKKHGEVPSGERYPFGEIDSHLAGYAGLPIEGWGTGFGCVDYEYYRLTGDSIELCFAINSELYEENYPVHDYIECIRSSATSSISHGKVHVVHHTTFELKEANEAFTTLFSCDDFTQYDIVKDRNGKYEPTPRPAAFDAAGTDSTTFIAEFAILKKVSRVKKTGTERQKFLLRNVEVDPATYIR